MITKEEEAYILSNAYVPEHIPKMMSFLSGGEPFLIEENYVIFQGHNFIIFIGYPLNSLKEPDEIEKSLNMVIRKFKHSNLYVVTDISVSKFLKKCKKIDDDFYYVLDVERISLDKKLLKLVEKAQKKLSIKIERQTTDKHMRLTEEFLSRKNLPLHVMELYRKLPEYMNFSEEIFYLSAYSKDGILTGYYIVETEAKNFSAYMIGCISKINYVPHTSDYLMFELIRVSQQMEKKYINLGIGVNEGIRRFKEKWGAVKSLKYEVYECQRTSSLLFNLFRGRF